MVETPSTVAERREVVAASMVEGDRTAEVTANG
jgi:hypothetical protein